MCLERLLERLLELRLRGHRISLMNERSELCRSRPYDRRATRPLPLRKRRKRVGL